MNWPLASMHGWELLARCEGHFLAMPRERRCQGPGEARALHYQRCALKTCKARSFLSAYITPWGSFPALRTGGCPAVSLTPGRLSTPLAFQCRAGNSLVPKFPDIVAARQIVFVSLRNKQTRTCKDKQRVKSQRKFES